MRGAQKLVRELKGRGFPVIEIDFYVARTLPRDDEWIVRARASRLPRADAFAAGGPTIEAGLANVLGMIEGRGAAFEPWDGDIQYAWWRYPQAALCWLRLIHNPHCNLLNNNGWFWRKPADWGEEPVNHWWNPFDWFWWWRGFCGACGDHGCLNYNDC